MPPGKTQISPDQRRVRKQQALHDEQSREGHGCRVDPRKEGRVVGDPGPDPHQPQSGADDRMAQARGPQQCQHHGQAQQIGNDLHWPHRSVVGGEHLQELVGCEGQQHGYIRGSVLVSVADACSLGCDPDQPARCSDQTLVRRVFVVATRVRWWFSFLNIWRPCAALACAEQRRKAVARCDRSAGVNRSDAARYQANAGSTAGWQLPRRWPAREPARRPAPRSGRGSARAVRRW